MEDAFASNGRPGTAVCAVSLGVLLLRSRESSLRNVGESSIGARSLPDRGNRRPIRRRREFDCAGSPRVRGVPGQFSWLQRDFVALVCERKPRDCFRFVAMLLNPITLDFELLASDAGGRATRNGKLAAYPTISPRPSPRAPSQFVCPLPPSRCPLPSPA